MHDVPLWTETAGPSLRFHPLEQEIETDLAVVGLGGSGLAAVDEGLARGLRVAGIDAGTVAGRAAGRNGGFLLAGPEKAYHRAVAAYGRATVRRFYLESLAEIDRMAAADPAHVRRTGSLRIATEDGEAADVEAELAERRADGFEALPYRGPEGDGFVVPSDAAMNPLGRCRAMARRLVGAGARLFERTPATRLGPGRVETPTGVIRAGLVVVAVDGGIERLVPGLAGRVRTARLQMLGTAPLPDVRFPRPVYAEWGYVYWQQTPDRRLVLGGGRNRFEADEWTGRAGPSGPVQSHLDRLRTGLGIDVPVTHRWAGHSAYTSDRRPVFEELHPGTVAVGAYSGHGNVTGALYAREAVRFLAAGSRTTPLLA